MKMNIKRRIVSVLWLTITPVLLASYSHARTIKPTESAENESNITHYNVYWGDALWVLVCSVNKRKEFCGKASNMAARQNTRTYCHTG
ncbi:MAG: hypothetical protein ACI86X_002326 [Moritella sp.]|jgi:hypothetical protein